MVSLISMWIWLVASVLLASIYPVESAYFGFCKQICEKHRHTDDAFTLNCDDHPNDGDCRRHCWFCKDMCTDHSSTKIYSCPENPDKKGNIEGGLALAVIIAIVIAVIIVIICIAGITGCVIYGSRRRGGPMGVGSMGVASAPHYGMSQQSMHYPTMSTVQSMPTQKQYQTTSGLDSTTKV